MGKERINMDNVLDFSNKTIVSLKAPIHNRIEAKNRLTYLLHTKLDYIFKETWITPYKLHMSFKMDENKYDLQMTIDFYNDFCDILVFINPRVLTKEFYDETLETVNYINWYVKANGRFYIDGYNDIVYSTRIPCSMIEKSPDAAIKEIHGAIHYYEDVFQLLIAVATGKKSYGECKDFIDKMWNH